MKRKALIMILLFFFSILVGCNYNETIILENNKFDKINQSLIEFKVINYEQDINNIGYYRGNIYVMNNTQKSFESNYNENLYVLNSDGSMRKSDLKIPKEYFHKERIEPINDISFSDKSMFNWKSGDKEAIVTSKMLDEITINTNHKLEKNLDFVMGSDSYAALVCSNEGEIQIVIIDINTGDYKITKSIKKDGYVIDKKINIFFNENTSQFYLVKSDGTITSFNKENEILDDFIYDKIDLEENYNIKDIAVSDGKVYLKTGFESDFSSSKQNIFFSYDVKNKSLKEIYKDSPDTKLSFINSNSSYAIVASRNQLPGSNDNNIVMPIELYKYHLARINGDNVEIIKAIAEDETTQILQPRVYINEAEKIVLVSSIINKGVILKYQVFGLDK